MYSNQQSKSSFLWRALCWIYRAIRAYFAFVGILVTLLIFTLIAGLRSFEHVSLPMLSQSAIKDAASATTLQVVLKGSILEKAPGGFSGNFYQLLTRGEEGIYVPELRSHLRQAAQDEQLKELYLHLDHLSGSYASVEELRAALLEFKQSQKKVIAFTPALDNVALMVGSVADEFILAPTGAVEIFGPAFPMVYFGEALKKLGVDIEVLRAGKFKSAFEAFVRNEPSPESIEMYQSIESHLREHLIKLVAEGRKKEPAQVAAWLKQSVFTADEAVEQGIVDSLGYGQMLGTKGAALLADYASTSRADSATSKTQTEGSLGLIEAVGEIHDTDAGASEDIITPDGLSEEIHWALEEDDIKAVVLRIASPGGSATASDRLWRELKELAEKKPLIVSMGSVAASGGYYLASAGEKILADPSTITGSIGVIGMHPSFQAFKQKYGVSFHMISGSDRRRMLGGGEKISSEDRALLEKSIEAVYQTFLQRVSEGRDMPVEEVAKLAQGRVYSGIEAKNLKLVDELGGLKDAFQVAKTAAGLNPEQLYPVLRYEENTDFSNCFGSLAKFKKCLRRGGSSLRYSLSQSMSPAQLAVPGVPHFFQQFVTMLGQVHEPMQMLWLDYPIFWRAGSLRGEVR